MLSATLMIQQPFMVDLQSLKLAGKMLRHSVRSKLILIRHLEICSDKIV